MRRRRRRKLELCCVRAVMKRFFPPVLALGLFLAGCNSTAVMESVAPSGETTNSIQRPVPPAGLGAGQPKEGTADGAATELSLTATRQAGFPSMRIHSSSFGDAKPVSFGHRSPEPLPVHGVDVSRWQGEIDWATLRAQGANFAFIKATEGGDHLDPMFAKNWRQAARAGLKRGAYHFFYWCRAASEQADWFIRNVPKEPGALPPVLDVEWNAYSKNCPKRPSRERVLDKMRVFLERLEHHYGQRPIIYTAPDFYRDNLRGAFTEYPFWLRSVAAHPETVYPGRQWVFWQYSGTGLSKGVEGEIDLNAFHGSVRDWHAWLARVTR